VILLRASSIGIPAKAEKILAEGKIQALPRPSFPAGYRRARKSRGSLKQAAINPSGLRAGR
jgi:hypothetical protein